MPEVNEGQLKAAYFRMFDLYCQDNGVSVAARPAVEAKRFIRWLLGPADGLPLIDRLKAEDGPALDEVTWDVVMANLASADAPLYFFHLFPLLCLNGRTCNPAVVSAEMSLSIKYADDVIVVHPPIEIQGDATGQLPYTDGPLCMAIYKVAVAFINAIKQKSLQGLHDTVAAPAVKSTAAASLIDLARQPDHGGFV